jgi:EAL domain-containing protein (putative c-di-GMP-specific phosphodiesterase class I)
MTTSIGIAIYPDDGDNEEALLKNADLAMYHAKRGGGNRYQYFSNKMTEAALRRLNLENHLHKAIERNELELYYQPIMDVSAGKFCGVEALLRWTSQELGSISPAEFIPLAEETGMIISIGGWVLRQACTQAVNWLNQGILLSHMAVNVSGMQFLHKGFSALVATVLAETGLNPHVLELELTESTLIFDEGSILAILQALNQIGIQLAIDDFGTGYSSLSRLKNFPINRLKIDQSFVRDIEDASENAAIVVAIIAMAESMKMKVTAEGVETEGQLNFLTSKRCHEIQGYLLSRPLPVAQAEVFLKNQ